MSIIISPKLSSPIIRRDKGLKFIRRWRSLFCLSLLRSWFSWLDILRSNRGIMRLTWRKRRLRRVNRILNRKMRVNMKRMTMRRILLLVLKRSMSKRSLLELSLMRSLFATDLWINGKFLQILVERFLLFVMQPNLLSSFLTLFQFKVSFSKTFSTLLRKYALSIFKLSSFQRKPNLSRFWSSSLFLT